jgi:GxxExxY protein
MELINEELTGQIINAALQVHKELGPGFLESLYEEAICVELNLRDIPYVRQKPVAICYKNAQIGLHRLDLIVDNKILLEVKAVSNFDQIHFAQAKSYLKATGLQVALLFNFNARTLEIKPSSSK